MTRFAALSAFALLFAPSAADASPLDADAFDAATRGRTVYFYVGGAAYGVEHYLGNRHVAWSFPGEECLEGAWFPQGEQICFVYRGSDEPHCWAWFDDGGRIRAIFENRPGDLELVEGAPFGTPLSCTGPEVGA
ncbi:hypothetical protein [Tropicimonas sp.]|uniref:hypothetical protein n=1 Tax=Tropicimonas sp. TaxID=2067044 RepID=UPI003A8B62B4